MSNVSVLQDRNVILRPAVLADAKAYLALQPDPQIARMYGFSRDAIPQKTRQSAENWAQNLIDHPYAWVIEIDGCLVGEARFDHTDMQDRRASFAIGIDDPARLGQGLGTQAMCLALRYAFDTLKLHRISVRVLAYNHRAIRAYQKCGFVEEGRERESAYVDGTWHDDLILGLLADQFIDKTH